MVRKSIYLGCGVGTGDPKDGHYAQAAVTAIHAMHFNTVRALDVLDDDGAVPTVEQLVERMREADAVLVPVCFRFGDVSCRRWRGERLVTLLERECDALFRMVGSGSGPQEVNLSEHALSGASGAHRPPRFLVPSPADADGVKPDAAVIPTFLAQDLRERVLDLIERVRVTVSPKNFFSDPSDLQRLVASLLLRDLPGHAELRVMISSSSRDLRAEHDAILGGLRLLGHRSSGTRFHLDWFAEGDAPVLSEAEMVRNSIERVDRAGFYLGLLKERYGTVVDGLSLTHHEFRAAWQRGMPRAFLFGIADRIDAEDGPRIAMFRDDVLRSNTPFEEYEHPKKDLLFKVLQLLDWLARPAVDQPALPPPNGMWYAAHPYSLMEGETLLARRKVVTELHRWRLDRRGSRCRVLVALGGMGKSAVSWAWFAELEALARRRPASMWWSFYAPESAPRHFAVHLLKWLRLRANKVLPPFGDHSVAELFEMALDDLDQLDMSNILVLDGIERILRFYELPGSSAHETEGATVENKFERAVRARRLVYGGDEAAARRDLLCFVDDANDFDVDGRASRAVVDRSPLAEFLRSVVRLGNVHVLVTTRFVPTVLVDLADAGDRGGSTEVIELEGLDRDGVRVLWRDHLGLAWEEDPLGAELGGSSFAEICVETLQGFAFPIVLLGELVGRDPVADKSFRAWKAGQDALTRSIAWGPCDPADLDGLPELDVQNAKRSRMDQVVNHILWLTLSSLPEGGGHHTALMAVLHSKQGTTYAVLRDRVFGPDATYPHAALRNDGELMHVLGELRQRKLVGRSGDHVLYDVHPLVRRAVRLHSPDRDESLRQSVEEFAAEWREIDRRFPGSVPDEHVDRFISRVESLMECGAPHLATQLYENVETWLRYRVDGEITVRRGRVLAALRDVLRRTHELTECAIGQGSTQGEDSFGEADLALVGYQVDNLELQGRPREALAMAEAEQSVESFRPSAAHCALAYHRGSLLIGQGRWREAEPWFRRAASGGGVEVWVATGLGESWAQGGELAAAESLTALLEERGVGLSTAGLRMRIAFHRGTEDLTEIVNDYDSKAREEGLALGTINIAVQRLEWILDGRVRARDGEDMAAELDALAQRAEALGVAYMLPRIRRLSLRHRFADADAFGDAFVREAAFARISELCVPAGAGFNEDEILATLVRAEWSARIGRREDAERDARAVLRFAHGQGGRYGDRTLCSRAVAVLTTADFGPPTAPEFPADAQRVGEVLIELAQVLRRTRPAARPATETKWTDTSGWSSERIDARMETVKEELDWSITTGSVRRWWTAFELENQHLRAMVLRVAEELLVRRATITEFFLAYVYSNTENIQANLHYLDFVRRKRLEQALAQKGAADSYAELVEQGGGGQLPPDGVRLGVDLPPAENDGPADVGEVSPAFREVLVDVAAASAQAQAWLAEVLACALDAAALRARVIAELYERTATLEQLFRFGEESGVRDLWARFHFLSFALMRERDRNAERANPSQVATNAVTPEQRRQARACTERLVALLRAGDALPDLAPAEGELLRTALPEDCLPSDRQAILRHLEALRRSAKKLRPSVPSLEESAQLQKLAARVAAELAATLEKVGVVRMTLPQLRLLREHVPSHHGLRTAVEAQWRVLVGDATDGQPSGPAESSA